MSAKTESMKEDATMKNLLKAIKFVKSDKKRTNVRHSITSREVEHINAGNSTSAWGIVFYR